MPQTQIIPTLKVMCANGECGHQIKSHEAQYDGAVYYDWLKCPKCGGIKFHLLKEKKS